MTVGRIALAFPKRVWIHNEHATNVVQIYDFLYHIVFPCTFLLSIQLTRYHMWIYIASVLRRFDPMEPRPERLSASDGGTAAGASAERQLDCSVQSSCRNTYSDELRQ